MNTLLYISFLGASLFLSSTDAFPGDEMRINRLVAGKNNKHANGLKELHPNLESRMLTVYIDAIDNINILSSGFDHNCVTFERDSKIRCWGSNGSGQLGYGDTISRGDSPNEMGEKLPFVNLGKNKFPSQLSLGGYHTCVVIYNSERAKCWGDNRYGQLALGDTNNRGDQPNEMGDKLPFIDFGSGKKVMSITTGYMHTCASLDNAKIACFGNNDHGQLGLGHTKSIGGSLNEVGINTAFIDIPVSYGAAVTSSASANHTCTRHVLAVRCWGANGSGQLGIGDTNNRGDQPNEMGTNLQAISFISGKSIILLFVGGSNTCLFSPFIMYCLGNNQYGQLGLGHTNNIGDQPNETGDNLKPALLGTGVKAVSASIGLNHICIVHSGPSLKCFGNNVYGQLGQGDKVDRGTTAATIGDKLPSVNFTTAGHISYLGTGGDRTCALFEIGGKQNTLKCVGYGANGALGYGDTNNRGDGPNEMGDNLPSVYLRYAPPSKSPSQAPSFKPTKQPTRKPSKNPTEYPTRKPSKTPTQKPTRKPK